MKQYTIRVSDETGKALEEYERVNGGGTGKISYLITTIVNKFFQERAKVREMMESNCGSVLKKEVGTRLPDREEEQ